LASISRQAQLYVRDMVGRTGASRPAAEARLDAQDAAVD
jgi:hypothetical protein